MLLRPLGDASEVVTLDEAKAHLRVTHDDDNDYISTLIDAAVEFASVATGRVLGEREYEAIFDGFPPGRIVISVAPLQSVEAIEYVDTQGVTQTYSPYRAFGLNAPSYGYVLPEAGFGWPEANAEPESVTIFLTAGSADIPRAVRHAILLLVSTWYELRESVSADDLKEIPFSVSALLLPHRVWG